MAELRDSLAGLAPSFDPVLELIPAPTSSQLVMDAVTHEHDLREAVGRPGAQDSAAVEVALAWLARFIPVSPDAADRMRSSGASSFTLMRALSGRMSLASMADAGLPAEEIDQALTGSPLVPPPD